MNKYLAATLLMILYYVFYNSLNIITFTLVEFFFGFEYIYIVNSIVYLIVVIILLAFIKKSWNKIFFLDKSFLNITSLIIILSIFFKLFKDPFLSIYEILGIDNIPKINKKKIDFLDQSFYVLYFVLLAPIAEEIMFRTIIFKKIMSSGKIIYAILFSSFLFSLIHLDPFNLSYYNILILLRTFIFGVIAAFIFFKTKNLIYSILFHIFSNLLAYLFNVIFAYEYFKVLEYLSFSYIYWLIIVISLIGTIFTLKRIS